MPDQNLISPLLAAITAVSDLINGDANTRDQKQQRRNLRMAKRMYKKLVKEFKKDGLTPEEIAMIDGLKTNLYQRTMTLGDD